MSYSVMMGRGQSRRTRTRDARRTPNERQLLQLMRELNTLADRFPDYSLGIHRLSYQVKFELRSRPAKEKVISEALKRFERLALDELVEETNLDRRALIESLAPMIKRKRVELCRRDGEPYQAPADRVTDALGRALDSMNRPPLRVPVFFRLKGKD